MNVMNVFNHYRAGMEFRSVVYFLQGRGVVIGQDMEEGYIAEKKYEHEAYESIFAYEQEISNNNKRIFKALKSIKSRTWMKHFYDLIESLDRMDGKIQFSKTPKGKPQNENEYGRSIKQIWIDQRAVGMEGDSFAGTCSIEVKLGKFLIIPYSC